MKKKVFGLMVVLMILVFVYGCATPTTPTETPPAGEPTGFEPTGDEGVDKIGDDLLGFDEDDELLDMSELDDLGDQLDGLEDI